MLGKQVLRSSGPRPNPHPVCGVRRGVARRRPLACRAVLQAATAAVEGELGWRTDFKQVYKMGKIIGIGFFGRVYIGSEIATGREVAIKVMPKQRGKLSRERTLEKLLLEVESLRTLQTSPNAVRLLGVFEDDEEVQMVTELCAGGDLEQLSEQVGNLPERAVALIAYEVLKVVDACHDAHILHGDIKPANFMLRHRKDNPLASPNDPTVTTIPWLAGIDFGCAQPVGDERLHLRAGTPTYMAPECLGRDYHVEADLWSVGATLYQLFARRTDEWRAFDAARHHILENPEGDAPLPLDTARWMEMSPEGRRLIGALLSRDYAERITAKEALQHPWFAKWVPNFKAAPVPPRTARPAPRPVAAPAAPAAPSSSSSGGGGAAPAPQAEPYLQPNPIAPATQQPQQQPQQQAQQPARQATPPPPPRPGARPAGSRLPPGVARSPTPSQLGGAAAGPPTPYTHKTLPPHMREIDERAPVFKPQAPQEGGGRPRWTVSKPSWWKWGSSAPKAEDKERDKVSGTSFASPAKK